MESIRDQIALSADAVVTSSQSAIGSRPQAVRDDYIPKADYVSPEVAKLERERLWPRTWQMACREEQIRKAGSYFVYDVLDQSILIVRGLSGDLRAFHNVCPHRGNQLARGSGSIARITCGFHGWRWDLEGRSQFVKDAEDWKGCSRMGAGDLTLSQVKVDSWGGFVFVNFDSQAKPLREYLDPAPYYLDCLEFEGMRTAWGITTKLRGNWKTALESFMESYHVFTTHPQLTPVFDEASYSAARGEHGMHGYPATNRPLGASSPRLNIPVPEDLRENVIKVFADIADQTGGATKVGNISGRAATAVERLREEVPAGGSPMAILQAAFRFMEEAAVQDGAKWPKATPQQIFDAGIDWNLFPNMVMVFGLDSTLVFRALPDMDDPNACVFDMWGLIRTSDENAPVYEHQCLSDWRAAQDRIPSLLVQDLQNIEKIQRGMASVGFVGSRTNPLQEQQIANLHRTLHRYLYDNSALA